MGLNPDRLVTRGDSFSSSCSFGSINSSHSSSISNESAAQDEKNGGPKGRASKASGVKSVVTALLPSRRRERHPPPFEGADSCQIPYNELEALLKGHFGEEFMVKLKKRVDLTAYDQAPDTVVTEKDAKAVHRAVQSYKHALLSCNEEVVRCAQFLAAVSLLDQIDSVTQPKQYDKALELIIEQYIDGNARCRVKFSDFVLQGSLARHRDVGRIDETRANLGKVAQHVLEQMESYSRVQKIALDPPDSANVSSMWKNPYDHARFALERENFDREANTLYRCGDLDDLRTIVANAHMERSGGKTYEEYSSLLAKKNPSITKSSLRYSKDKGLYRSSKLSRILPSSTHKVARAKKQEDAYNEVKESLERQFGVMVANKVFERLELTNAKEITYAQSRQIDKEVQLVKRAIVQRGVADSAQFLVAVNLLERIDPATQKEQYREALKLILERFVADGAEHQIRFQNPLRDNLLRLCEGSVLDAPDLRVEDIRRLLTQAVTEVSKITAGVGDYWTVHNKTRADDSGVRGLYNTNELVRLRAIVAAANRGTSSASSDYMAADPLAGRNHPAAARAVAKQVRSGKTCSSFINDYAKLQIKAQATVDEAQVHAAKLQRALDTIECNSPTDYVQKYVEAVKAANKAATDALVEAEGLDQPHRAMSPWTLQQIFDRAQRAKDELRTISPQIGNQLGDEILSLLVSQADALEELADQVKKMQGELNDTVFSDANDQFPLSLLRVNRHADELVKTAKKQLEELKSLAIDQLATEQDPKSPELNIRLGFMNVYRSYDELKTCIRNLEISISDPESNTTIADHLRQIDAAQRAATDLSHQLLGTLPGGLSTDRQAKEKAVSGASALVETLNEYWDVTSIRPILHQLQSDLAPRPSNEVKESLKGQFGEILADKIFERLRLTNAKKISYAQSQQIDKEVQLVKRDINRRGVGDSAQFLVAVNLLERIDPATQKEQYCEALKLILERFVADGAEHQIRFQNPLRDNLLRLREGSLLRPDLPMYLDVIRPLLTQAVSEMSKTTAGDGDYWTEAHY